MGQGLCRQIASRDRGPEEGTAHVAEVLDEAMAALLESQSKDPAVLMEYTSMQMTLIGRTYRDERIWLQVVGERRSPPRRTSV